MNYLMWNEQPIYLTGEYREPQYGEIFLEPPQGTRPLRVLECHPAFHPDGPRIIVTSYGGTPK